MNANQTAESGWAPLTSTQSDLSSSHRDERVPTNPSEVSVDWNVVRVTRASGKIGAQINDQCNKYSVITTLLCRFNHIYPIAHQSLTDIASDYRAC